MLEVSVHVAMRITELTDWAAPVIVAGVKVIAVFESHMNDMRQCASTVASGYKPRLLSSMPKAAALRVWSVLPAVLHWIAICDGFPVVYYILSIECQSIPVL